MVTALIFSMQLVQQHRSFLKTPMTDYAMAITTPIADFLRILILW